METPEFDFLTYKVVSSFWAGVEIEEPDYCWPYTKANDRLGYGVFNYGQVTVYAHRISCMLAVGESIGSEVVRHTCNNPPCVNPTHLSLGTQRENILDTIISGKHATQVLSIQDVLSIVEDIEVGLRNIDIAVAYNVSPATISSINHGQRWGWLTGR